MKSINIGVMERIKLASLIGSQPGTVAHLRDMGRLLDVLEFSPDEKESVGMREQPDPTGNSLILWDSAKVPAPYELSFEDADATRLATIIENAVGWSPAQDRVWVPRVLAELKGD
jgi:hypothetical protein